MTVQDPYRHLEDPLSNVTKSWIAAETNLTNEFLKTCDQSDLINDRLAHYLNYPKVGAPTKYGDHYYFTYNSGKQNDAVTYKITEPNKYLLNQDDPLAGTELFFDPNQ